MSSRPSAASAANDDVAQETTNDEDLMSREVSRRRALGMGAGAAIALASAGTASAQTETPDAEDVSVNFDSEFVHDPYVNASVTVTEHLGSFSQFEFTNNAGEVADLGDDGFTLARAPDDEDTPHNPVSLKASAFYTDDDGSRTVHDEYGAFPRGVTYDDDGDSDTEEEPVSALDATHWTTSDATNGSITVADGEDGTLDVSTSSVASGETVSANFDLSSVGSSDGTITSGVLRKHLQTVVDVDALPSGALVELAVIDSTGAEVTATIDPSADLSEESVFATSTGDAKVGQAPIGELGSLEDIEQFEIRVSEADATLTFHGLNLDRESAWTFGSQERQTTNDDDETIVEVVDVEEPDGDYSITDLGSLDETPFGNAAIAEVTYDAEMRASEMDEDEVNILARLKETPSTYDRPHEIEIVVEYNPTEAYATSYDFENLLDEVALPQSRYTGVEVATGVAEIEDWEDVEDTSWTSRTSSYDSVGDDVELYSSLASSDRTYTRHRYLLDDDEADDATSSAAVAAVGASGGGGSGGINWGVTGLLGFLAAAAAWFRKDILGALSR